MFIDYNKQFLVNLVLSVMFIIFKTAKTYKVHMYDFALSPFYASHDKVIKAKYVTHLIYMYESPSFGKLINNSKYKSV